MPWNLRPITHPQDVGYDNLNTGDWWYATWWWDHTKQEDRALKEAKSVILSTYFWRDWGDKRSPVCVRLPGGADWMIDARANNGDGWVVTGEEGLWTASPSILVSKYHGWLKDGVLSDDLDGRIY